MAGESEENETKEGGHFEAAARGCWPTSRRSAVTQTTATQMGDRLFVHVSVCLFVLQPDLFVCAVRLRLLLLLLCRPVVCCERARVSPRRRQPNETSHLSSALEVRERKAPAV